MHSSRTKNSMAWKGTTPNCDLFAKPSFTDSHLKCTLYVHESLKLILDAPISALWKFIIYSYSPKMHFNILTFMHSKIPFRPQQVPTVI